ncbi:MAG: hypothetical protein J6A16_12180 [Oscillospiraceae bacterium]|nr:hypothetical protein [Oscillospiraceae bacterium]
MNDNERLVTIIEKARKMYADDYTDHTENEYIAEALLDSGVILPPVNVGDTVYEIFKNRDIRQRKVTEILIADDRSFVVGGDIFREERYHFSSFGDVVFRSFGAAMAELEKKRRRKGGAE